MERTNVIELKYYQPAAPVCATRPARRSSRREHWQTLATAAEANTVAPKIDPTSNKLRQTIASLYVFFMFPPNSLFATLCGAQYIRPAL